MCGRFSLSVPPSILKVLFNSNDLPNIEPNYNIVPTTNISMVAIGRAGDTRIVNARWGLMPQWLEKDPKTGPLFNARAETIMEKPSFKSAFQRRRCIIPADGFYEWHRDGKEKTPYFIYRTDSEPMAFAGIWEMKKQDDRIIVSTSIITTAASKDFSNIHQRFPVILEKDNFANWLDNNSNPKDLENLLKAPDDNLINYHIVSSDVNKTTNNFKELQNKI